MGRPFPYATFDYGVQSRPFDWGQLGSAILDLNANHPDHLDFIFQNAVENRSYSPFLHSAAAPTQLVPISILRRQEEENYPLQGPQLAKYSERILQTLYPDVDVPFELLEPLCPESIRFLRSWEDSDSVLGNLMQVMIWKQQSYLVHVSGENFGEVYLSRIYVHKFTDEQQHAQLKVLFFKQPTLKFLNPVNEVITSQNSKFIIIRTISKLFLAEFEENKQCQPKIIIPELAIEHDYDHGPLACSKLRCLEFEREPVCVQWNPHIEGEFACALVDGSVWFLWMEGEDIMKREILPPQESHPNYEDPNSLWRGLCFGPHGRFVFVASRKELCSIDFRFSEPRIRSMNPFTEVNEYNDIYGICSNPKDLFQIFCATRTKVVLIDSRNHNPPCFEWHLLTAEEPVVGMSALCLPSSDTVNIFVWTRWRAKTAVFHCRHNFFGQINESSNPLFLSNVSSPPRNTYFPIHLTSFQNHSLYNSLSLESSLAPHLSYFVTSVLKLARQAHYWARPLLVGNLILPLESLCSGQGIATQASNSIVHLQLSHDGAVFYQEYYFETDEDRNVEKREKKKSTSSHSWVKHELILKKLNSDFREISSYAKMDCKGKAPIHKIDNSLFYSQLCKLAFPQKHLDNLDVNEIIPFLQDEKVTIPPAKSSSLQSFQKYIADRCSSPWDAFTLLELKEGYIFKTFRKNYTSATCLFQIEREEDFLATYYKTMDTATSSELASSLGMKVSTVVPIEVPIEKLMHYFCFPEKKNDDHCDVLEDNLQLMDSNEAIKRKYEALVEEVFEVPYGSYFWERMLEEEDLNIDASQEESESDRKSSRSITDYDRKIAIDQYRERYKAFATERIIGDWKSSSVGCLTVIENDKTNDSQPSSIQEGNCSQENVTLRFFPTGGRSISEAAKILNRKWSKYKEEVLENQLTASDYSSSGEAPPSPGNPSSCPLPPLSPSSEILSRPPSIVSSSSARSPQPLASQRRLTSSILSKSPKVPSTPAHVTRTGSTAVISEKVLLGSSVSQPDSTPKFQRPTLTPKSPVASFSPSQSQSPSQPLLQTPNSAATATPSQSQLSSQQKKKKRKKGF